MKCFETVSRAIPQRSIMPITNNFLFVIMDQTCRIYAYNGKLQIQGQIQVESTEDVSLCIPANTLLNTVKLLDEEELIFNYNAEKFILNIAAGKKKYKITGVDPKDYPIQSVDKEDAIELKVQTAHIIEHIKALSKIVDWSEMREFLAGVTLVVNNGKLEISGVNGARYFYRGITSIEPEKEFGIVLHKDIAIALGGAKGAGDTEMIIGKRSVSIKMDGFDFTSVLIDVKKPMILEKYFDYDREKYIVVDKNEFLGSLRRLSNYSNDESTLLLSIEKEELKLNSENTNYEIDGEEVLDIQNESVDDRVFGLNINYLLSVFSNIKGDKIKLFNGTGNAKMVCIQDYENTDDTEIWGVCEFVIVPKTETV